jgi:hypothetical protein
VVLEGFVYRARWTNVSAGSWHAHPALPEELADLPRAFWQQVLEKARALGCEDAVARLRRR